MGIELLKEFGRSVLHEMTQIFAKDSNVVIPFTEDSLKEICILNGLDYDEVSESFKEGFVSCGVKDKEISLACCAFQVMIAYECLAADLSAYNGWLAQFIRSEGKRYFWEEELLRVFAYKPYYFDDSSKQELLWEGTRDLLKENGLNLCIPPRKKYKGRFIQYPLSQRIIDRDVLEKYIGKFNDIFGSSYETEYSLAEFSEKMFGRRTISGSRYGLSGTEADKLAKKIIFYCYCNWVEHEVQKRGQKKKSDEDSYKVKLADDKFNLFKNDKEVKTPSVIVPLRPFTYDETYNEWLLSYSDLDPMDNITLGVLLDRSQWKNNSLLTGAPYFEWSCSADLRFYINPEKYIERRKKDWFKRENIKFVGGVKDNDGRWILSFLPTITNITEQNSIIVDHKSYSLNEGSFDLNSISATIGEGVHFIKLFDRAPISFWTVAPGKSDSIQVGWTWKRRKADFDVAEGKEIVLSGLYTNVPSDSDEDIKHWGNKKIGRLDDKYDRIVNVSGRKGWN